MNYDLLLAFGACVGALLIVLGLVRRYSLSTTPKEDPRPERLPKSAPGISEQSKADIVTFLQDLQTVCPCCGNEKLTVMNHYFYLPSLTSEGKMGYGGAVAILVLCGRCSNLRFFDAVSLGVYPGKVKPPEAGLPWPG